MIISNGHAKRGIFVRDGAETEHDEVKAAFLEDTWIISEGYSRWGGYNAGGGDLAESNWFILGHR